VQHFLDLTDKIIVEELTLPGIGHHRIKVSSENGA